MKNERELDNFVQQNVHYRAHELIQELSKSEEYQEQIWEFSVQDNWEEPALWFIDQMTGEELQEELGYIGSAAELKEAIGVGDDFAGFCDKHNIEPYQNEALEFWIVSDWLGEMLQDQGEMVADDFLGFTIWGRTTSGQAISMDHVIGVIYDNMMGSCVK